MTIFSDIQNTNGYWEAPFIGQNGNWIHSCNDAADAEQSEVVPPEIRQYGEGVCTDPALSDIKGSCPGCQGMDSKIRFCKGAIRNHKKSSEKRVTNKEAHRILWFLIARPL